MNPRLILVLLVAAVPPALAQNRPPLPQGVTACETCHGDHGEGNRSENAPRIAGQSAPYLAREMANFASGARPSQIMTPIAKGLDDSMRSRLADYYANLDAPLPSAGRAEPPELGRTLATRGDDNRDIQACANCHGPDGIGEPPTYPYIGGQHRQYLIAALRAWQDGSRRTDPSGQMSAIARHLTDGDIAALADYYAAAQPPKPGMFAAKVPIVPGAAPAGNPQGPAGSETKSVGSEQGTPTTGGAQGPGGGGATAQDRPK